MIDWQWTVYSLGGLAALWLLGALACMGDNVLQQARRRERRR